MNKSDISRLVETRRRRLSTGSPEAYVHEFSDETLHDKEAVARMRRGGGWPAEPERFLAAAEAELEWRKENRIHFGWTAR